MGTVLYSAGYMCFAITNILILSRKIVIGGGYLGFIRAIPILQPSQKSSALAQFKDACSDALPGTLQLVTIPECRVTTTHRRLAGDIDCSQFGLLPCRRGCH